MGGGGGSNTPIGASCYRNRVKLRPLGLHLFFLTSSCLANRKSFLTNKGKLKTNPGGIVACSVDMSILHSANLEILSSLQLGVVKN